MPATVELQVLRRLLCLLVAAGLAALQCGCGGRTEASVAGTVTLDGDPLGAALVSFVPENPALPPVIVSTDAAGEYGARGVAVGRYKVRVTTYQPAIAELDPPTAGVAEKVPAKYNIQTTLSLEVSSGTNNADFPLDSDGPIIEPQEGY